MHHPPSYHQRLSLAGHQQILMVLSLSALLSACGEGATSSSSSLAARSLVGASPPATLIDTPTTDQHHILSFDQHSLHHTRQFWPKPKQLASPRLVASTTMVPALAGATHLPPLWWSHVLPSSLSSGPLWRARSWALNHPTSRSIIVGSLVIVAAITATGHYLVTASIQGKDGAPLNHDSSPLVPESIKHQPQPGPPAGDPMMVPIPHFSHQDDSSLVIYPSQSSPESLPTSLLEQQRLLETKMSQVRDEQKIIDRIHQLNLELYAHKQGITVAQIPQDVRLRLESEQNFKYITNHVNELSEDNMDRLMKRIDELEGALATLNNSGQPLPANARMIDKFKHQLNIVLQGLAVGLLFVMFL